MDVCALSKVITAHRRAMAVYRKEHMPLGRNAVEVMLYAYGKSGITATEISRSLLHSNISQTKRIVSILVTKKVFYTYGSGKKGKPNNYFLTEEGYELISKYCRILEGFI